MSDATINLEAHESDQCTVCTSTLNFQCAVIHFLMLNQNQCHDFVLLVETNFIAASCLGLRTASYAISLELITSLEVYKFTIRASKTTKAPTRVSLLPIIYSVVGWPVPFLTVFGFPSDATRYPFAVWWTVSEYPNCDPRVRLKPSIFCSGRY